VDSVDEGLANVAFATLIRRHAAIGEDEAGHAGGRGVMDEVLHPGEVGVAARGKSKLPARVVVFAEPVGVVEGRVGEDEVGTEIGVHVAAELVGGEPELGFEADIGGGIVRRGGTFRACHL